MTGRAGLARGGISVKVSKPRINRGIHFPPLQDHGKQQLAQAPNLPLDGASSFALEREGDSHNAADPDFAALRARTLAEYKVEDRRPALQLLRSGDERG